MSKGDGTFKFTGDYRQDQVNAVMYEMARLNRTLKRSEMKIINKLCWQHSARNRRLYQMRRPVVVMDTAAADEDTSP